MQVGYVVFRCGTAFDEVYFRAFFDNNHRMFKLACARCVETEIALQRNRYVYACRYVYIRAAGPDSPVQCRKFMVCRRHQFHKMGFDDVFVFFQCRIKICIDDALLYQFILNAVVHNFGVILGADTGKRCFFGFRNPQAVESIFDIVGYIVPVGFHLRVWADIRNDVVHVQFADIGTPVRVVHFIE